MPAPANAEPSDELEISSTEAWARFDEMAQRFLSCTGSEFVYRLEAGGLDLDDPKVSMVRAILPIGNETGR